MDVTTFDDTMSRSKSGIRKASNRVGKLKLTHMKKRLFSKCLAVFVALTGMLQTVNAQTANIEFYNGTAYICGVEQKTQDFKVNFCFCCGTGNANCDPSLCNIGNPYKAIIKMYRNGSLYNTTEFNLSSPYFYQPLTGFPVAAGTSYYATVQFQRKKNACIGWETIAQLTTNTLNTPVIQGTPDFNINGTAVLPNWQSMDVCASNIKINAAATTCEKDYFVGITEYGNDWSTRTYDYEVNLWFAGEAPNNINLQNIATTYSYPPYYTGSASRQGSPLIGGNLANGQVRHYSVSICIGPTWTCKSAFIKVNGSCRTADGVEDTNEYTVLSGDPRVGEVLEGKAKLGDLQQPEISVFPNPSSGIFNLSVDRVMTDGTVTVMDYTGKEVLKTSYLESGASIDLSGFKKGIYLVTIKSNDVSATKTIILE